ncbi:MAG: hypothetical protein ACFFC1_11555 [Promethearchaeota archaeon]
MELKEIEIFKSLKIRYLLVMSLLAFLLIFFSSIFLSFGVIPWYYVLIVDIVLLLILVPLGIYGYKRNAWISFVISKEKFMISKPKKVKFEIYWSEFDIMKLKVLGSEYGSLKPQKLQRKTNIFKIKLFRKSDQKVIRSVKFAWLSKGEARQITDLIFDYATKLGKEVIIKTRDLR